MFYRLHHRFLLCLFMFLSIPVWAFDTLTATVDKNPVMADESITLTVVANASLPRDAFDTSVLEKDFKVIRTSVSSHTQIINLSRTITTTWTTLLFPRREGLLTIPALNVNNILSEPIELMVMPANTSANQDMRDIFMTAELLPKRGYVMQQFTYTVKLYLAVELERGSLQVQPLENVIMEQMGEDTEANIIQNGKRYRMVERTYSIIPQVSGPLTIPAPIFEGAVRTRNRGSFGGLFNPSKPVNQLGPEVSLDVQPIPANYPHPWLPSEFVQINEEWSDATDNFVVGEPITRTITLSALGVDKSLLPDLEPRLPPDVKAYSDQAQVNSIAKDNNVISQRVETYALVPSREGSFVLPDIKVPWFNTLTGTTEFASIPARSIQVKPNPATAQTNIQPVLPQNVVLPPVATVQGSSDTVWYQRVLYWQVLSGLLLILLLWALLTRPARSIAQLKTKKPEERPLEETTQFKDLLNAIKAEQADTVEHALQNWLGCWYPKQAKLVQYIPLVKDNEFSQWLNIFYAQRYLHGSLSTADYQTMTVWATTHRKQLVKQTSSNGLPALYPNT